MVLQVNLCVKCKCHMCFMSLNMLSTYIVRNASRSVCVDVKKCAQLLFNFTSLIVHLPLSNFFHLPSSIFSSLSFFLNNDMLWEKNALPFLVLTPYYLLVRLHLIGKAIILGSSQTISTPLVHSKTYQKHKE